MSFFQRLLGNKTTKNSDTHEQAVRNDSVSLSFAFEEIVVDASTYNDLEKLYENSEITAQKLVNHYQNDLGIETERIKSYKVNGQVVPGTTQVKLGDIVKVYISGESKGQR